RRPTPRAPLPPSGYDRPAQVPGSLHGTHPARAYSRAEHPSRRVTPARGDAAGPREADDPGTSWRQPVLRGRGGPLPDRPGTPRSRRRALAPAGDGSEGRGTDDRPERDPEPRRPVGSGGEAGTAVGSGDRTARARPAAGTGQPGGDRAG